MKVLVITLKHLIPANNGLNLIKIINVLISNHFQKLLVLLHLYHLFINFLRLLEVYLILLILLSDLFLDFFDLLALFLDLLVVLLFSHLLLLQESGELDKIILDHDIFLSEFAFLDFESLFLGEVFFFLVFEGFLYFVHQSSFLKESCGWWDGV